VSILEEALELPGDSVRAGCARCFPASGVKATDAAGAVNCAGMGV